VSFHKKYFCRQISYFFLLLLAELKPKTGFYLKQDSVNGTNHLILCYSNEFADTLDSWKSFFIKSFFDEIDDSAGSLKDCPTKKLEARELSISDFYEQLRIAHEDDDLVTGIPSEVQHPSLRPILRNYQKRGIKWMLKRELHSEPQPWFVKLQSKFNDSQVLYMNKYTGELFKDFPEQCTIPTGGLLTGKFSSCFALFQAFIL
jgi:hypothetical protein